MLWASSGDAAAKQRAEYVVSEMAAAQAAHGASGYLSAFPETTLKQLSKLTGVWAPIYTLHKVGAPWHHSYGGGSSLSASSPWLLNFWLCLSRCWRCYFSRWARGYWTPTCFWVAARRCRCCGGWRTIC